MQEQDLFLAQDERLLVQAMFFLCKENIFFVGEDKIFFLKHSNGTKRGPPGRYGSRKD
jgi:hypothetical protein